MKTKMNITNLKKMAVTVCSALFLTTGSFTQPMADPNSELNSMDRLEAFMNATEHSVKFVVPVADETDEIVPAMERLEMLAANTEASIQYVAPAAEENEEVASATERLEMLAGNTEKTIMFKVPGIEESLENESERNADEILVADQTPGLNQ